MSKNVGGRPSKLSGLVRVNAVRSIRKRGLTHTQAKLAAAGVKVSIGTLHNLAKKEGIVLKQGRPAKVAA